MTQPPPWPKSLTTTIANQIQRIRSGRDMSAQQLADATAALGYAIPRSVIANLESGRRDTVSIAELMVFARALRVPPLVLVFPAGTEDSVEVSPETTIDSWLAAKWFTGETPFPVKSADGTWTEREGGPENWRHAAAPAYFRDQDALIARWQGARQALAQARVDAAGDDAADREVTLYEETVGRIEDRLRYHRRVMREVGLNPGALPAGLAHVDEVD